LKILFCTNKFREITNGPAKFANLVLQINNLFPDHEIKVLTEDIEKSSKNVFKLDLCYPNFIRPLSNLARIYKYNEEAKRIKKSKFDFDVIIYNNSFIGLLSCIELNNCIGMVNDDNNASRNWKSFKLNYTFIKQFIFKQLERAAVRNCSKVITNSEFLTNFLIKEYPFIEGKVYMLYKAIELPSIKKQFDRNLNKKQSINVLFVKEDFNRGGLKLLIDALSILDIYFFTVVVIGPALKFENSISKMAIGVKNINLSFIGPQKQQIVYEKMIEADIFCVPSKKEALGVANLEALSIGLPVISTRIGGIPEILNCGNNGWMVEPNDPLILSNAILECITNTKKRKLKVENGLEFSKRFSIENVLCNFIKIIEA
jgi:colanic acid/amylovoran biosynthesis glycosyltransferase